MIREAKLTEFTRRHVHDADQGQERADAEHLRRRELDAITQPSGILQRAGTNHWAVWRWDPNAVAPDGLKGNYVQARRSASTMCCADPRLVLPSHSGSDASHPCPGEVRGSHRESHSLRLADLIGVGQIVGRRCGSCRSPGSRRWLAVRSEWQADLWSGSQRPRVLLDRPGRRRTGSRRLSAPAGGGGPPQETRGKPAAAPIRLCSPWFGG